MITTLRAGYVVKFLSTKGRSCASRRSGTAARVEPNYPGLDSGTFTRDPAGAEMYEVSKVRYLSAARLCAWRNEIREACKP